MIANGNILCKVVTPTNGTPKIRGHIVDGSKTFTFKMDNSNNITVDVDNNGNWIYIPENSTFSAKKMFRDNSNLDEVHIENATITDCVEMFFQSQNNVLFSVDLSKCKMDLCENANYMFRNCLCLTNLNLPIDLSPLQASSETFATVANVYIPPTFWRNVESLNATYGPFTNSNQRLIDYSQSNCKNFKSAFSPVTRIVYFGDLSADTIFDYSTIPASLLFIKARSIKCNIPLTRCSSLFKESVLNIINAAAANVTYTLHSTVYAKCASGGEWYTDIQAAINAKALEGYTVTLISE